MCHFWWTSTPTPTLWPPNEPITANRTTTTTNYNHNTNYVAQPTTMTTQLCGLQTNQSQPSTLTTTTPTTTPTLAGSKWTNYNQPQWQPQPQLRLASSKRTNHNQHIDNHNHNQQQWQPQPQLCGIETNQSQPQYSRPNNYWDFCFAMDQSIDIQRKSWKEVACWPWQAPNSW